MTKKTTSNSSLTTTVDSYLAYYASSNSHTSRAKRLDLNHFLEFLANLRGLSKVSKLKLNDWDFSSVQRFVDDCLNKGESPATVARRLATLKHMGRTLSDKVPNFINPAKEVKNPKVIPGRPKALTKKEVKTVKSNAKNIANKKQNFKSLRNKTIFDFIIDTGLRAEEVRILKMGQIDEDLEWIKNVRTKGRRYRNVYITSKMRPTLETYLEERKKKLMTIYGKLSAKENKALPVFISIYKAVPGKQDSFFMGAKSLWRAINELSTDTSLHPHLLRHSYAIDLLDSSNDIRLVAQALGHSDVRITMRYTERKDQEVAKALEKSRKS